MRLLGRLALLGGILAFSTPAQAQEGPDQADTEGARLLFEQGLELVEQEDWSRAADRFRSAIRLRRSPAIEYNLAVALFQLGQLNEAEELVVGLHDNTETPEPLRETAWELAGRIPAAGGQLSIRIEGPSDGVDVYLDDRRIPTSRLGVAMTASLGAHSVEARRDYEVLVREETIVSRDIRADVLLPVDGVSSSGDAGAVHVVEPDDDASPSIFVDWRFWAAVGGGVLLVATIILIAAAASGGGVEEPIAGNFMPGVLTWE